MKLALEEERLYNLKVATLIREKRKFDDVVGGQREAVQNEEPVEQKIAFSPFFW